MKNLKNIATSITFALVMLVSFNVNAQRTLESSDSQLSKKDKAFIKSELQKGMASFVESVRPFYRKGANYKEFVKILGAGNSTAMPEVGKSLLKRAHGYLSNGLTGKEILSKDSGKEMGDVLAFVVTYNKSNKTTIGDTVVFGLDKDGENSTFQKSGCRWYQVGCHLSNLLRWIEDHWDILMAIFNFIEGL